MNLSSIAKKNCYYSLNCVGAATKDALKIEFKTYYTTPGMANGQPGLGVGTLEEIDLPPLDGNEISTPILSQYSSKLVHFDASSNNDTGAGTTYEIPALFDKQSSHWEFYTYDHMIQKIRRDSKLMLIRYRPPLKHLLLGLGQIGYPLK